jgi:hypothetical protein
VYWAVGSSATLGGSSELVGNILAVVSITFGSGSAIVGRGLASAAVTFASGSNGAKGEQSVGLPSVEIIIKKVHTATAVAPTKSVILRGKTLLEQVPQNVLGGCQNSALQASTTITFDGGLTTIESGDIGVAPGTSITGNYDMRAGTVHRNDAYANQCAADAKAAYKKVSSLKCTNVIDSDLANLTLLPGVYCSTSGRFVVSSGTVTLDGLFNPQAEFVFQTESTFITASSTAFKMTNLAREENVYWAIGSSATLGVSSTAVGNILAQVSITFGSGSSIVGRGLAQAAITFASGSQADPNAGQTIGLPEVYISITRTMNKGLNNLRGFLSKNQITL